LQQDLPGLEEIHDNLVSFSFGVEDFEDLKADVLQALEAI
jgi:cystathionine gamma-synthase